MTTKLNLNFKRATNDFQKTAKNKTVKYVAKLQSHFRKTHKFTQFRVDINVNIFLTFC